VQRVAYAFVLTGSLAACRDERIEADRATSSPVTSSTPPSASPSEIVIAPPTPTPIAPPPTASLAPTSAFPLRDDTCEKDEDCGYTSTGESCCYRCAPIYGNKRWVAEVASYCATKRVDGGPPGCKPVVCSYVIDKPHCKDGRCQ
jgi:hypothetical protein